MQSAVAQKSGLRDKLTGVFAKAKLPSSPALATRILSLADNPDTNTEEFAGVIQMDAALSARLLKMANAASLGLRTPVTNISRAVKTLGIAQVKTAALGFQLVGHLHKIGGTPFEMKTYWQHSALRGCLAREVAKLVVPSLTEEAFLVGLLEDCGILLLVQILGEKYASLFEGGRISPAAFFKAEQGFSEHTHVDAVAAMAAEWKLPEIIAQPLARHHKAQELTKESKPIDRLCAVCYFAGNIHLAGELAPDASDTALLEYAKTQLGISQSNIENCFKAAGEAYAQTKDLLGDTLPDDFDVTDILSEANNRLTSAAADAEEKVRTAAAEQAHLSTALGEYRERASRDPLTSVLNRGALVESGTRLLNEARQNNDSITVIFLDIDNFKKLNDTYGHKAGDEVLVGVAMRLTESVQQGGCLGRYGGEEFVMVVPHLATDEAKALCETTVQLVRTNTFPTLNLDKPVTASIGGIWIPADQVKCIEEAFAAADKLMYQAKKSGKDRACFEFTGKPQNSSSKRPRDNGAAQTTNKTDGQRNPEAAGAQTANDSQTNSISRGTLDRMMAIADALNRDAPRHFVTMRKQPRKEMLVQCAICGFIGSELRIFHETALVRNISTGGLGLLSNRHMMRGDPLEITIPNGPAPLYVTGLVCFCRHIETNIYDVGVQFTTHSQQPIFSHDPVGAANRQTWLADALDHMRRREGIHLRGR